MGKPNITFRVLIIGRANSGKTTVLQRVCDTTDSPEIYRKVGWGRRERIQLDPTTERGEHDINDELIFSNHDGYVFHDSRGIESGSEEELNIVQKFVQEKSTKKRPGERLHAIWYCIPMDDERPSLNLRHFHNVCPDRNVPVIAVFTKYDQFRLNIEMNLEDCGCADPETEAPAEAERVFKEHYLSNLGAPFVCLERMHETGKQCTELLATTANALNDGVIAVMLFVVQRENLELSMNVAVTRGCTLFRDGKDIQEIILVCLGIFPSIWIFVKDNFDEQFADDIDAKKICHFIMDNVFPHCNDFYHFLIAATLILDCATLLYLSGTNRWSALDQAKSKYFQIAHGAAAHQFPAAFGEYSDAQLLQFILNNRLLKEVPPT